MKTAEEILAAAADLVEFSGRWVGRSGIPWSTDDQRPVCIQGAVFQMAGCAQGPLYRLAMDAVEREVAPGLVDECVPLGVWEWNDAPGRTKEEVATALRNAKRWLPSA